MTPHAIGPIRLEAICDPRRWEDCRSGFPHATVFHRWDWCTYAAAALGMTFVPYAFLRGTVAVGLAPVLLRRRGPVTTANWVPFPYLGPLVCANEAPAGLDLLRVALRRHRSVASQLAFAPAEGVDAVVLARGGYRVLRDATLAVPLAGRDDEDLWRGLKSNPRRSIRHARRRGFAVRASTREDVVATLPRLLARAYARNEGSSDYTPSALAEFWRHWASRDDVRMATVVEHRAATAVCISVADRDTAYLWLIGARRAAGADLSALLYWDALTWALARGCARMDLVGSPTPGIAEYKRRLGAALEEYLVARRFEPPVAERALALHGRLRAATGRARAAASNANPRRLTRQPPRGINS